MRDEYRSSCQCRLSAVQILKCVQCITQPNTSLHDCILSHSATMAFDQALHISAFLGKSV